eukprot:CAMPEP_0194304216 /NCGR_PEP_ID=MMETSP0171-20130528/2001_1 /TAXON_ID=218684 /ORGANISM="Corethron pennatum, Strain L29A3" /LENGTH=62 /DNA_ID=CAMNT_0039055417 /DNA_START=96 /DNA_END=284 /DNA_ORIENTATION=-
MGKNKQQKAVEVTLNKKEQKKVSKLEAQIPFHEGRGHKDEAEKIRQQIKTIWEKATEASYAM